MSETNRLMTEDERERRWRLLMGQLRHAERVARADDELLAADWLKWHIDLMEIEGGE